MKKENLWTYFIVRLALMFCYRQFPLLKGKKNSESRNIAHSQTPKLVNQVQPKSVYCLAYVSSPEDMNKIGGYKQQFPVLLGQIRRSSRDPGQSRTFWTKRRPLADVCHRLRSISSKAQARGWERAHG